MKWAIEIESTEPDDNAARRRLQAARRYLSGVFRLEVLDVEEVPQGEVTKNHREIDDTSKELR